LARMVSEELDDLTSPNANGVIQTELSEEDSLVVAISKVIEGREPKMG
jgi:hypothetical protein